MKNKRGITLIALIITIIILLILTGITLSAIMGDNGLLTQAMKSKTSTDESSAKELLELAWSARMVKFLEEGDIPITNDYLLDIMNDLNINLGGQRKS